MLHTLSLSLTKRNLLHLIYDSHNMWKLIITGSTCSKRVDVYVKYTKCIEVVRSTYCEKNDLTKRYFVHPSYAYTPSEYVDFTTVRFTHVTREVIYISNTQDYCYSFIHYIPSQEWINSTEIQCESSISALNGTKTHSSKNKISNRIVLYLLKLKRKKMHYIYFLSHFIGQLQKYGTYSILPQLFGR